MNIKQVIVQLIPALIFYLGIFFIIKALWDFNAIIGMFVLGVILVILGISQMDKTDEKEEGDSQ